MEEYKLVVDYKNETTFIETFDKNLECEVCGKTGSWQISDNAIGLCDEHLNAAHDVVISLRMDGKCEMKIEKGNVD
jgi:hypothetical protein